MRPSPHDVDTENMNSPTTSTNASTRPQTGSPRCWLRGELLVREPGSGTRIRKIAPYDDMEGQWKPVAMRRWPVDVDPEKFERQRGCTR